MRSTSSCSGGPRFTARGFAADSLAAAILAAAAVAAGHALAAESPLAVPTAAPREPAQLEALRSNADAQGQRAYAWNLLLRLATTRDAAGHPAFESWHGDHETFAPTPRDTGPRHLRALRNSRTVTTVDVGASPGRAAGGGHAAANAPLLAYTLYNGAAWRHIRRERLYLRTRLEQLRTGAPGAALPADGSSVPAFPRDAIVLKTAWWPFAPDRPAPLPVWDPQLNPARAGGNDYTVWRRIVLVDPRPRVTAHDTPRPGSPSPPTATEPRPDPAGGAAIEFAGHRFANPRRVPLEALYSVPVDAALARSTMRDPEARRAALLALGRELRAGDVLALVALHVATRELHDWTWATWWWHDEARDGPYAQGRPAALERPWRNYLMQVAFDDATPAAADGNAHVCFNPWLEARFPDGGNGGGTLSNCLACHRRASYPPVPFLPVTRGPPRRGADPAYEAGRVRTSFLWSIPLRAAP